MDEVRYNRGDSDERPWGRWEVLETGDGFCVKRITVKPGAILSLQLHHHREEHWVIVKGRAVVTRGDETIELARNQCVFIPVETQHRIENPGPSCWSSSRSRSATGSTRTTSSVSRTATAAPEEGMDVRKVALVTGGSRGIGAAVCRLAARDGYDVAINYAGRADAAERVAAEVRGHGRRAVADPGRHHRSRGGRRHVRHGRDASWARSRPSSAMPASSTRRRRWPTSR